MKSFHDQNRVFMKKIVILCTRGVLYLFIIDSKNRIDLIDTAIEKKAETERLKKEEEERAAAEAKAKEEAEAAAKKAEEEGYELHKIKHELQHYKSPWNSFYTEKYPCRMTQIASKFLNENMVNRLEMP